MLALPQAILPGEVEANVQRIVSLWRECRTKFGGGGSFLFGRFSAADAMYAPVASRFLSYIPNLGAYGDDGTAQAYVETIFAMPEMAASGLREPAPRWPPPADDCRRIYRGLDGLIVC